jgi:hypothetical protein
MAFSAADIKMVDDHIAQGERHVTRQHEIIAWLKSRGHPTDAAENLLLEFEATLRQHRAHRDMMLLGKETREAALNPLGQAHPKGL